MRFHNIIAQTQSQPGSGTGWFGGEERLEDFIDDGGGDAGAIIADRNRKSSPPSPPMGGSSKRVLTVTVGLY